MGGNLQFNYKSCEVQSYMYRYMQGLLPNAKTHFKALQMTTIHKIQLQKITTEIIETKNLREEYKYNESWANANNFACLLYKCIVYEYLPPRSIPLLD